MMLITRCWGSVAVLLCALLLQDCQPHSVGVIDTDAAEELTASSPPSVSAMRQGTSSDPLAVRSLTSRGASPAACVVSSLLSTTLANEEALSTARASRSLSPSARRTFAILSNSPKESYNLPAAARPRISHSVPLGKKPGVSSSVFTTSSGERVRFGQVDGQWRAAMQADCGGTALQRALPVVGPADVGSFLSWLQSQDKWTSRARIHILEMLQAPYGLCVYLDKAGLLGGVPASPDQQVGQGSLTAPQEEWMQGPTIILSGNQSCTEVFHIPSGYCYKGYRLKEGSMVPKQASYTVRYVEGNSRDEIDRREGYNERNSLDARLSADLAQVMTLGTIGGGMQHAQMQSHQGSHRSGLTHAALVVCGNTQQERLGRRGRFELALEILVVRDAALSSNSFSIGRLQSEINLLSSQRDAWLREKRTYVAQLAERETALKQLQSKIESLESQYEECAEEKERYVAQPAAQKGLKSKIDATSSKWEAMQKAHDERIENIEKEWSAKLLAVCEEKESLERGYKEILKQQQASQQATGVLIADLSRRRAAEKRQLQVLLALQESFGAFAWQRYYGEVGEEPALPDDIEATLDASCPFWPDRKVRDTHLLVLMPATVDGIPFSLNLLKELIERPKSGGHRTRYNDYDSRVQEQVGSNTPDRSYWLLMTRDVLPESRCKTYADQKALVAAHASRTGLPYELPKVLEAATAILTRHVQNGERLCSDHYRQAYMRCQELIRCKFGSEYQYPVVVGGFGLSSGLAFCGNTDCFGYSNYCVAGCRKL
jgi:hypothetical protein